MWDKNDKSEQTLLTLKEGEANLDSFSFYF